MERLSFTSKFAYNASEAAIHMARYQLAAAYCKGKRVLDIACGEGYGSFALRKFGATSVEGVDNTPDAIATAKRMFSTDGITYRVADATAIDSVFAAEEFDVIVSLETIEHLQDPARFLAALKRVAKKDAVIIVSCPNDRWYYPTDDQSNPFHVRKYTFDEFRQLAIGVLGDSAVWGFGVPMVGFGNVTDDDIAARDQMMGQAMMLDFSTQASSITLPQRQFSNVGPRNCCYFVGVWGGASERLRSAAVLPISMDQYNNLVSWEAANVSPQRVYELEAELANSSLELATTALDVDRSTADYASLAVDLSDFAKQREAERRRFESELAQLRNALHDMTQQSDSYRVQAFALAKELDIVMRRVTELTIEQQRLLNDPKTAIAELIEESRAIESRASVVPAPAAAPLPGISGRLKHASKIRLVSAGRAVKPYLPHRAKALALRIARKLNL